MENCLIQKKLIWSGELSLFDLVWRYFNIKIIMCCSSTGDPENRLISWTPALAPAKLCQHHDEDGQCHPDGKHHQESHPTNGMMVSDPIHPGINIVRLWLECTTEVQLWLEFITDCHGKSTTKGLLSGDYDWMNWHSDIVVDYKSPLIYLGYPAPSENSSNNSSKVLGHAIYIYFSTAYLMVW